MEEIFGGLGFAPFGVITAICFIVGLVINYSTANERVKRSIPEVMILVGAGLGIAMFFTSVEFRNTAGEFWWALAIGGISGVAATGIHQVWKQKQREDSSEIDTVNIITGDNNTVTTSETESSNSDAQNIDNSAIVSSVSNDIDETIDPTSPTVEDNLSGSVNPDISEIDPTVPTPEQKYKNPEAQVESEA